MSAKKRRAQGWAIKQKCTTSSSRCAQSALAHVGEKKDASSDLDQRERARGGRGGEVRGNSIFSILQCIDLPGQGREGGEARRRS